MSVQGICHVCNEPAPHTCGSCGASVCSDHYDDSTGFCVECVRGRRME